MKHKILISEKVAEETINMLEENHMEIKYGRGISENDVIEDIKDCDAVMVRVLPITKKVLDNAPNLKIIAKHGVGCDSIDIEEAHRRGIPVVYAPGSNSQSVAEHTMALILACARHLKETNLGYAKGDYQIKNRISFSEISGKTLSIIGFGNIAKMVAAMAYHGFNMRIVAYDTNPNISGIPEYVQICSDINEVFSVGDFVSVHIPGTSDNTGFINYDLLCKMKSTSFIINTSRGNVIDTNDLLRAIDNKIIAGAGLDVCDPEPAPVGSKLFADPRIILTPHSAAASKESMINMGKIAAQGVIDFLGGKPPKYVI